MKLNHVINGLLIMILFPEGPNGACHSSCWLLLSLWVTWIPTAWRGFAKGWWRGDMCLLTTCLSHTISLHGRRKSQEALANMTDGRGSASHTPVSLPPSSLSPKTCFKYEMSFFATQMLAANPGKHPQDWWDPRHIRGPQVSKPTWC